MNKFRSTLGGFLFRWRFGLLLTGVLHGVLWLGVAFLAAGIFDYYAGFDDSTRRLVFNLLIAVGVAGAVWALWLAITFMRRDAASVADAALRTGRRDVLSALELQPASGASNTPLAAWLRGRMVENAAQQLSALPVGRSLPGRALGRGFLWVFAVAAVIGLFAVLTPAPFQTIARRLLEPQLDLPPYSPLKFVVGPQPAEVLYGGELLISSDISGGKLEAPVRCLTRDPANGKIEESPAFQENPGRFSRKLEKVASGVEVAFAVGRARSAWLPVKVRMQPKVQEVIITVEPPPYSRQPRREFALGSQDLAALPGSKITARVTSNRPLGAGTVRLAPHGVKKTGEEVAGEREEMHRVKFSWTARGAALVSLEVRDIAGTASETVQVEQRLLPDERPEVVLRQPVGDVMATPETELPLEAQASDDLGLTRMALVRKLVGYRERSLAEPVQSGVRRHEVTGKVNLKAFGVVPGQTIELAVEAGDTNPSLLGVSVSEPARIHIITREKYAELLRDQTTLQEFADRYAALQEALDQARKALDELEKAAATGDQKKAEEARQKAFEAHKKSADLFGKIAEDFPIFDLDKGVTDSAKELAKNLGENGKELDDLRDKPPGDMAQAVPEMKKRLGEAEKQMQKELKKGERAVAAAKVVEQAGKFKGIIEQQRELVKDLDRAQEQIRRGETQAAQALPDLGRRQRDIEEELKKMEGAMEKALKELPEEFAKMREEGDKFLEMLRELKIPPDMIAAAEAAEHADSKAAGDKARVALEKLEALLKKKNGVCQMCQGGGGEEPFPWPEDLSETMKQLMRSLIPKPGEGPGEGEGEMPGTGTGSGSQGLSGNSDSGFSMKGKMPRMPIYGPPRSKFSRNANSSLGGGGQGEGKGQGSPEARAEIAGNQLDSSAVRRGAGEAAGTEAVPEVYRDAVKRFFSADEKPAGTPAPK